ncbi:hypothetical protein LRS10_18685 [Phenylobacterium sp. J426]|nr:hypothetical protein [Phenylobacterium sp. J426]MCR5875994.1 hypothetical protein [Phenylobacterium sp. J426]
MTTTLDYAHLFETEFRPRRRLRRAAARVLLAGLFLVRPRLALSIWRER